MVRETDWVFNKVLIIFINMIALGTVVCLHLPSLPQHLALDWAVPWFFFASGFWYARSTKPYGEQIRSRVKSLLVPYYLWNLIWFPVLFVVNWIGWKYCGASRMVDESVACVVRCLGLSPIAWPALVPTWFLRALFMAVVIVGALDRLLMSKDRRTVTGRLAVCVFFWLVYASQPLGMFPSPAWRGFFSFGVPLLGCACFATGLLAEAGLRPSSVPQPSWVRMVRRQMMPVYLLHAVVIMIVGWGAKALHCFDLLTTWVGDVVMWLVGIGGAVVLGEVLRRLMPRVAGLLFGGR